MTQWEYLVIRADTSPQGTVTAYITEQRLDEEGQEGWELVGILGNAGGITTAVFKRKTHKESIK